MKTVNNTSVILKRKCYSEMLKWKKEYAPEYVLFLKGARRTGKTTLAEEFGKNEYKSYIKINFQDTDDKVKDLFINGLMDLDLFFSSLELIYKKKLYPNNSLIILDEIQLFPEARQSLKTLLEDKRFHYIETGSHASITKKSKDKEILIPSEEYEINVLPLDFEEFLWALDDNNTFELIKERFKSLKPFGQAILKDVMKKFRIYMCIGGMPQAIVKYKLTKDFEKVDFVKRQIINLYKNDMKNQNSVNKDYVGNLFLNIPSQLSKHDKEYIISQININARISRYNNSLEWLEDAMIVNIARNINEPSVALSLTLDDHRFKSYLFDTGLLLNLALDDGSYFDNNYYRQILMDNLHINEGMFIENVVAQCLRYRGHKLRYHVKIDKEKKKVIREVDFLIRNENKIIPIEVKSSNNYSIKSLLNFINSYKDKVNTGIVLCESDIRIVDNILYLPYFMASVL